jgi:zinc transport system ATP-binding protein
MSTPVLELQDITFAYDAQPVIEAVSATIRPGEFVALVGPNGAGKSTLLRVLLGLLAPTAGTATLFGAAPAKLRDRARLGYVPQRGRLDPELPVTVRELVAGGRITCRPWWRRSTPADRAAVAHALDAVALADRADEQVTALSGGQQQRALIARALVSDPEFLVLDEPIAGVDAESQRLFRDSLVHLVAEHRTAVLLVSHELGAVAGDLDRVIVLKRRVLFDGPPATLADRGISLGVHDEDLPRWLEGLE